MTDAETLTFATDFPPATQADWRKLVDAVLKGAPFERLRSTTYDGLAIEPLAVRRPDASPVAGRPGGTAWQVMARIEHPDPASANAIARRECDNGASGLTLVFAGAVGDHGFALPVQAETISRVLEGIEPGPDRAIEFDLSPQAAAALDAALARGQVVAPPATNVRLGHDPLGEFAIGGAAARPWSEEAPHFGRRIAALARDGFAGRLAVADGRIVHNAGGSEAQELAFALGAALAYLRALEAAGVPLEAARRMIFFRLAADADQFLTIAKFRALRKLWARVENVCGLPPEPSFVAAETAWRMMARRDPYVNILRATIATFAAALGGADAITVLPFTAACGLPDRFARRIARNTQLVLGDEAHLAKVADPAAGSGAVEDLTGSLCRASWALFQTFEAAGGIAAALESGLVQGNIATVRERRAKSIALRRDALTGVSLFPDLQEIDAVVEAPFPTANRKPATALAPLRLAEPFEALRETSDRVLAASGARPKVFLATLGTPADFTARATFTKNFFEAGGIAAIGGDLAGTPDLPAAFTAAGASLTCLCSSDKLYEREAVAAARALKAAGAKHIYLAGRPADRENELRAAGVQTFVYEGCDALATLNNAYAILGIETG